MKVMKFGGTSVGSVNSILSVKRIVEAVDEPVIVVVSALGGITDKLINTSRMAAAGDASYENEFREIVYRHVEMIKEVIPAGEAQVALQRQIGELLNELKDIFQGIYLIKDLSQKTSDTIVSYGERLSSIIVAQLTGAEWFQDGKEAFQACAGYGADKFVGARDIQQPAQTRIGSGVYLHRQNDGRGNEPG